MSNEFERILESQRTNETEASQRSGNVADDRASTVDLDRTWTSIDALEAGLLWVHGG